MQTNEAPLGKTAIWLIVLLLITGGWWLIKQPETEGEAIKIGAILPMTGWAAYWGEGEVKGIELATEDIRARGEKIDVVIEDSATDPAKSATVAHKLISVDKVHGLVVEYTAPSAAVSPIAFQYRIPMVYDAFIKKPLETNPYAVKVYFDIEKECAIGARYLKEKGYKNIGALILNIDLNPECKRGIINALGKEVAVRFYDFNIDVVDFRTYIAKMKADGIDAVLNVAYEDNAYAFFKQKGELKFNVPVYAGAGVPDNFTPKMYTELPQSFLEGTATYNQRIRDWFTKKLKARFPEIQEKDLITAAYGYDEVMYLYEGLSSCGTAKPECVIEHIKKNKTYESAISAAGFGDDRVIKITPTYYQFKEGKLQEITF